MNTYMQAAYIQKNEVAPFLILHHIQKLTQNIKVNTIKTLKRKREKLHDIQDLLTIS